MPPVVQSVWGGVCGIPSCIVHLLLDLAKGRCGSVRTHLQRSVSRTLIENSTRRYTPFTSRDCRMITGFTLTSNVFNFSRLCGRQDPRIVRRIAGLMTKHCRDRDMRLGMTPTYSTNLMTPRTCRTVASMALWTESPSSDAPKSVTVFHAHVALL